MPAVEVLGLLVIVVEYLRQDAAVGGVAERIGLLAYPCLGVGLHGQVGQRCVCGYTLPTIAHGHQVWFVYVLPAVTVSFGDAAAALRKAGIAYLATVLQYLAAGGCYSLAGLVAGFAGDALVTLAMVIGTHVEYGVVLAVVPAY